jgi:predicted RNA-binding Zn ribbon-like protein
MVRFEFTGGNPCLDFANTTDDRATDHPQEQLTDYARLVEWGSEAGVITRGTGERLHRLAAAAPARALTTLRAGVRLRETIHEIFSAVAQGRTIPAKALASLNDSAHRAAGHAQVVQANRRFTSEWIEPERHLDSVLWPVSRAAAELLLGAEIDDVRQCASETCSWLFVDRSKNHRRRWCDMNVCGNRDKARRYYQRRHTE